jgi:hypothetical protein
MVLKIDLSVLFINDTQPGITGSFDFGLPGDGKGPNAQ